jgi:hypothetical protein
MPTQHHLKFNNYTPPDVAEDGYSPSYAVTVTQNSGRTMRGKAITTPLFTVEAFDLKWNRITTAQVARILHEVMGKEGFQFHYFSYYHNAWRTTKFYMANATLQIKSLKVGAEKVSELSFQVTNSSSIT